MIRITLLAAFLLTSTASANESSSKKSTVSALDLPVWTEQARYKSPFEKNPFRNRDAMFYTGLHLGLRYGTGTDLNYCHFLREFFCVGVNAFIGKLNSALLVRAPMPSTSPGSDPPVPEVEPINPEYREILDTPESWTAFVPQLIMTVNSPILAIRDDRWSDSATVAFGPAFIGGRTGWAASIEPALNRTFRSNGNWGFSLKGKYTFGWLNPKGDTHGTIPFDWYNLSAGIYYVW
jgi:hypothetical protein